MWKYQNEAPWIQDVFLKKEWTDCWICGKEKNQGWLLDFSSRNWWMVLPFSEMRKLQKQVCGGRVSFVYLKCEMLIRYPSWVLKRHLGNLFQYSRERSNHRESLAPVQHKGKSSHKTQNLTKAGNWSTRWLQRVTSRNISSIFSHLFSLLQKIPGEIAGRMLYGGLRLSAFSPF